MIQLRSISLKTAIRTAGQYPFTLPLIQQFQPLEFTAPVTFLVGENGSGKSTLLEALAAAVNLPVIGGDDIRRDPSLEPARNLAKHLKLVWGKRTHRGFFLRAEDFFNFSKRMKETSDELEDMAKDFEQELSGYALRLAQGVVRGQRHGLVEKYGEDLNANSHGESFLKLFQARFVPDGFYILDEPEAPLSPQRQIAFLMTLKDMVGQGSQFIIATHSPIIMAFPGAKILSLDSLPIQEVAYDDLEHVRLTRDFLNQPERFLRHL
ncbi:MAG: AAA family ATPase [Blastocatellia bacterium]|nr:AAA family ATPase [Blastocatellia bacterium]